VIRLRGEQEAELPAAQIGDVTHCGYANTRFQGCQTR
jgi:hypothetical protein